MDAFARVDGESTKSRSEPIAEDEQPAGEVTDLSVGAQHRKVRCQILDLRLIHRAVKAGPVSIAEVPRNDKVHLAPESDRRRMTEQLLGPVVPPLDDTGSVSLDHSVVTHDVIFSPSPFTGTRLPHRNEPLAEQARQTAVKDALVFIEDHALFTRTWSQGIRQVIVRGLVATAFTHRDSRDKDPGHGECAAA